MNDDIAKFSMERGENMRRLWAPVKDPTFAERVYRFFGEAPPWTDGAKEGEKRM
jgi:hypothetical protein